MSKDFFVSDAVFRARFDDCLYNMRIAQTYPSFLMWYYFGQGMIEILFSSDVRSSFVERLNTVFNDRYFDLKKAFDREVAK